MNEYKDVKKECALMFKALFTRLDTIATNDLPHLRADIKENKSWLKATFFTVLAAALSVIIKAVFL